MKAQLINKHGSWREVADRANETINLLPRTNEPPSSWKRRMLLAEHSPIRTLSFTIRWIDIMYWVSVHFVRHKIGIEHFVSTQRSDRTLIDRDSLPQSNRVNHTINVNAQALIIISRKRLCMNASKETRNAWKALLETLKDSEPELFSVCVPDCIYRGHCHEFKSCGFSGTAEYMKQYSDYTKEPSNA